MQVILGIFIFLIGGFIGIMFMCLFQVNRDNDNLNYEVKIRKSIDKWKKIKDNKQKEYNLNDYEDQEKRAADERTIIIAELVAEELENIL